MFRFPDLADFLCWELIEVAAAMEDGSYWEEGPFYGGNDKSYVDVNRCD